LDHYRIRLERKSEMFAEGIFDFTKWGSKVNNAYLAYPDLSRVSHDEAVPHRERSQIKMAPASRSPEECTARLKTIIHEYQTLLGGYDGLAN
jgi:hypothetical protein